LRGCNDQRAKIQLAPQADTTIITGIDDMVLDVSEMKAATMRLWKAAGATLLIITVAVSSSVIFASAPVLAQNTVKLELWSRQDPSVRCVRPM